jgi:hypothetical protein
VGDEEEATSHNRVNPLPQPERACHTEWQARSGYDEYQWQLHGPVLIIAAQGDSSQLGYNALTDPKPMWPGDEKRRCSHRQDQAAGYLKRQPWALGLFRSGAVLAWWRGSVG